MSKYKIIATIEKFYFEETTNKSLPERAEANPASTDVSTNAGMGSREGCPHWFSGCALEKNDFKIILKGVGKYFFDFKVDGSEKRYNILEPIGIDGKPISDDDTPIPLSLDKGFYLKDEHSKEVMNGILSQAFVENKRLTFEVKYESPKYFITSISKAD